MPFCSCSVVAIPAVLLRRALRGPPALAKTQSPTEEVFSTIARFASHANLRTGRTVMASLPVPPTLKLSSLNTESFHSVWIGDHSHADPDVLVVFYIHGPAWSAVGAGGPGTPFF